MSAMYRSVVEGGQIPLPLTAGADEIALLKQKLTDKTLIATLPESVKEYPNAQFTS